MVIIIHQSSARVQDKHFICLLLPNKTTPTKLLFAHVRHACAVCMISGENKDRIQPPGVA